MNTGPKYFRGFVVIFLVLITFLLGSTLTGSATERSKIDFYITPETDYHAVGELISYILETELGLEVNMKVQYSEVGLRKVATGKGDLFIGLKLPPDDDMSRSYSIYQLCNLGPIYEDVVVGWGVPAYIPEDELNSIDDLASESTKNRLQREIIVYESEKEILKASKRLVNEMEELHEYSLVELKENVANTELDRATRNEEWIVMSLRRPSLPFSLRDFRFIEKLTPEQSVHLFGRNDLMAKFQDEVTQFLSRFYLPIDLVNELIRTRDRAQEASVRDFTDRHPELVAYWINGVDKL